MWLKHPAGFVCLKPPSCQGFSLIFTKKQSLFRKLFPSFSFEFIKFVILNKERASHAFGGNAFETNVSLPCLLATTDAGVTSF